MALVGRDEGQRRCLLLQMQHAHKTPEEFVKMPIQAQEAKVGPTVLHF